MQLRAPSRTRTRRSLFRSLAGILIASAALAAFLASALGARPVRAASSSAFIRINQLGYATTATKRAYLMTSGAEAGATFYVNTGVIGDSAHMSWSQLQSLFAAGNDIGGHTLTHANLKHLKAADAHYQVCQDRDNLLSNGLQPTAFAYPFGSFDSGTEQIVAQCGYNSGRGVSGVNDTKAYAETIPPADPYATRTPPNPKQGTTVATIEGYVAAAEQHGGGWVQLVFHHLCNSCDAYSITVADFTALLDWLQPRAATGTTVETTAQVIGGPVNPPVPA